MPDGPMDTQDILAWGTAMPERATIGWECERLLIAYATLGGRSELTHMMQLNFEVMLCDFTNGVQILDHRRGEMRLQLDLMHLISLYDTVLAPSLVSPRLGQDRRTHRVFGIDRRDTDAVRVQDLPHLPSESGIDWGTLFRVIRDRYATRLEVLQSTFQDTLPQRAFRILQTLLMPYRLYPVVPSPTGSSIAWAAPVFQLCAQTHTLFIESSQANLTASELLLLASSRETTREICRTLVGMWAEGVAALRDSTTIPSSVTCKWRSEVDRLLKCVGWAVWTTCRPACAFDESCYLPGAPFNMDGWNGSESRCIRLFEPYTPI
ncbi:hypothetical protein C8R43DRAFT_1177314 [Mycena crocata]|nr:hypothetical protein C8R43DRAFT_1177314 [Mycena crocata]